MSSVLIIVKAAQRRYAVRREDVLDIKIVRPDNPIRPVGTAESFSVELAVVLEGSEASTSTRHRALMVQLPGCVAALLVDDVEAFLEHTTSIPLPAILRERLCEPWAVGALVLDDDVILQLDLPAIARSVQQADAPIRTLEQ